MLLNISGLLLESQRWEGKMSAHILFHATSVPRRLVSWGRSGLAFGCRWVFICRPWPHSVVCHVNGLYRQSQGVASSGRFLLLRPVSSRSQLCTSGAILPAGRVGLQPRDCFCFYGASGWGQPGVGRDWKVTPLERVEGPCAQALFPPLH